MKDTTDFQPFTFRLHSNGVSPESFKAREIGKLIIQLEHAFQYYLEAKEGASGKDFSLSLVSVVDASCGLGFIAHQVASFMAAFLAITTSIDSGDYSALPAKTIQQFQEIQKLVRAKNCVGDLMYQGKSFASIKSDTKIAVPDTGWIRGETVIYGEIKRVGGKDPTVTIELDTGSIITCNVSRAVARQLGAKLYAQVALKGYASWSAADYTLLDFSIESVTPYAPAKTNKEAFAALGKVLGRYWDAIDDVDSFLLNNSFESNL